MWYILGIVGILLIAIIWWLMTSVGRGEKATDEKILKLFAPLSIKLEKGATISSEEVARLARPFQNRSLLYRILKDHNRLDLFPVPYLDAESQGKAILAHWLMHPNEIQEPPEEIELVEAVTRRVENQEAKFFVFRYRMRQDHWAGKDGWLLGLSGPFFSKEPPFSGLAGAFSRGDDQFGKVQPSVLVDWFIKTV